MEELQQHEKKWTLDNEEEDEENTQQDIEKKVSEDNDEIDPLDAFMSEVNKEVRASKYGLEQSDANLEPKKGEIIETEDEIEPVVDDFDIESSFIIDCKRKTVAANRPFQGNYITGSLLLEYKRPTPIQSQAIPAIISGRDVIGIAKTGSGKTLAFLLPMFRHILDQPELEEMDGPIAVIMSPTRELAMQTWKEASKFAKQLDIRVACVYGGVGISDQIGDLKRGAEVVVCTVGRLTDMLAANKGKVTNLRRVTYLVLDEADRMFDMGFEPQVMKIVNNIRPDRQTVLFSATFPRQMEALARKILDKPIEIMCCNSGRAPKMLKLLELLGVYWENGNVLVFVDKQEKADDLVAQLMRSGYNCAPLHGGIDQFDRDSTILDYKAGKIKLLVATSVAARGLDIKKLILVVNYDCPNHYEDYVHRVGRTGRAGNKGYAYTFILPTGQERMAGEVCRAFETAGKEPPEALKKMWEDYKAHMAAEGKTIHIGGCGFSGSGYKYDQAEDEKEATRRKVTRLMHGMENAVDDDDDDEIEQQLNSMMKGRRRIVEGHTFGGTTLGSGVAGDKLEKARAMAAKIAEAKQLGVTAPVEKDATSLTAEAVMRGSDAVPIALSAKSIAKQKAEQLNEQLKLYSIGVNSWSRNRNRTADSLAQVQEYADVGISVKGSYYPGNKEPKDGERKLFLFLEARSELALRRAREEILRIMKDTVRQMAQTGARNASTAGRYKVF
ncbi:Apoptosis regulator Bcl-2 [Dirofilaria immitis]|nr:Apoptosis regulator Bcl-2 [Dirofilaria immitis]